MDQSNLNQINRFLSILFRPGEHTCFSKHASGTTIFPVTSPPQWVQYLTINPIHASEDLDPYEEYHSAERPRRADANCIAFRNILMECDRLPLEEQAPYIEDMGVPWSTCIYSGKKSLHFIIALEEGYATKEEYDHIVYWLHSILEYIDHSNKNPSRLSRFPEATRIDTGKKQTIIELRQRVTKADLEAWLNKFPGFEPAKYERNANGNFELPEGELGYMSRKTREFLMYGAEKGERNSALYLAARDLHQQGWLIEVARPMLLEPLETTSDYDAKLSNDTIDRAFAKLPRHPPRLGTLNGGDNEND